MILVLCHPGDRVAVWLADGLADRTARRVEAVTVEALLAGSSFEFASGDDGAASLVTLADGRRFDGGAVALVVNRLATVPNSLLMHAAAADRAYGREEMHAILVGWLSAFAAPVVNRPHPRALSGFWPEPLAAHQMAAAAGLPVASLRAGDGISPAHGAAVTAIVHAGRVFGPVLPETVAAAAVRYAAMIGTDLLPVLFDRDGGLSFIGADPLGDWRAGGRPLLDALAARAALAT